MDQILETPDMIINPYVFGGGAGNITLIDTDVAGAINGGDVTLNFTAIEDDVVIVFGGHKFRVSTNIGPTVGGWTLIDSYADSSGGSYAGVWYKRMTATPDASVTNYGSGSAADAATYGCYVLRGVHADVIDVAATQGLGTGSNPDGPSITTVTNNAWVLSLISNHLGSTTASAAPSGYSNLISVGAVDSNPSAVAGATIEKATAGAEDPGAFTMTANDWVIWSVAIKPA